MVLMNILFQVAALTCEQYVKTTNIKLQFFWVFLIVKLFSFFAFIIHFRDIYVFVYQSAVDLLIYKHT